MFSNRLSQHAHYILLIAIAALFVGPTAPAQASVCTLVDHIKSANSNTAVGFCPAGTSHDVITITEDITLSEELPAIRGTITIEGGGHTISGDKQFPIFIVRGGWLTVNNLTLTEGYAVGSKETKWVGAGAIQMFNGANVFVNHSVFTSNRSGRGHGGAIGVDNSKLSVNNSTFENNRSAGQGGAIYVWYSTAAITNSSFVGNRTREQQIGGAIFVGIGVELDVSNSTFYGNYAGHGGAVGSEVWTPGGPIASRTTLTHVTMINNRAGAAGLGIWIDDDDKNFNLRNSIIASAIIGGCRGPLNENIGNLIKDGSCAPAASGDPMVAEKTGSPAYYPLLDGSPALDAADPRFCPETDQIGTARPQGGGCDIGAIESTTAIPMPTELPAICPLPDQIIAANTDTAVGNCPAGNGADIIYMIRDFTLSEKLPPITSEITIEGNGYTISANKKFQILDVDSGILTIKDVILAKGSGSRGGAIRLHNGAQVTVSNVEFSANEAVWGGAISTESSNERLVVENSSFVGNRAENKGGAIVADGGIVSISGSSFTNNAATQFGGAIEALRGQVAIANSTLSGNKAQKGGGIYVSGAETTLTHLTLMNNVASRIIGAGIYVETGQLYLRNSIIAGSGNGDDCSGRIDQNRGNFSQDGSCSAQAGGDPMLAEMVGSPAHHPLLDASPAHGAADPTFCLATDQLGNQRINCDIGAIESERSSNVAAAQTAALPANCSFADQIIAANTDAPAGACPAGEGADTIVITRHITLSEALPAITGDVTINGNGHTISGDHRFRILDIESGKVTIKHMTLVNGRNPGENPDGYGGAITLRNSAGLTVVNVTFRNNKARFGGAVAAIGSSSLKVFESSFFDNEAEIRGGAIWNNASCARTDNSTFSRNTAGSPTRTAVGTDTTVHKDGNAGSCLGYESNYFSDT